MSDRLTMMVNLAEMFIYLVVNHSAWIIPGTHMKKHNTMLIIRSLPAPFFKKTATGGKRIDRMISNNLLSMNTRFL